MEFLYEHIGTIVIVCIASLHEKITQMVELLILPDCFNPTQRPLLVVAIHVVVSSWLHDLKSSMDFHVHF
jgi:hypothetical protein